MSIIANECENYLVELRFSWLQNYDAESFDRSAEIHSQKHIEICGVGYLESIYSDFSGQQIFIIFEVSRKKLFRSVHYCVGVELLVNGKTKLLSNEELWEYGIP